MSTRGQQGAVSVDLAPADDLRLPRYFYDSSLLFDCMDRLQIDRRELADNDPLLFRELQGRCALCLRKAACAEDLARPFDDAGWARWQEHCPNAATLATIGAVQNCPRAAQYLRMPH